MVSTRKIIGRVTHKFKPDHRATLAEIRQLRAWRQGEAGAQRPQGFRLERADERLAHLVLRRSRLGRKIQIHQLASVPETALEKRELDRIKEELAKNPRLAKQPKKLASIKGHIRTLQISKALRAAKGGRNPNAYDILAVQALQHGLDSEKLRDRVRKMETTYNYLRNRVTWQGSLVDIYMALRARLPNRKYLVPSIEQILFDSSDKPLDSHFLCQKLGLNWNKKNSSAINAAMQLLDMAQLVRKMPMQVSETGRTLSVWMHNAHFNPKIDYPNTSIYLLEALAKVHGTYAPLSDYYKEFTSHYSKTKRAHKTGNPNAPFGNQSMRHIAINLQKSGLVESRRTPTHQKGSPFVIELRLTPHGRALMTEYAQTNRLPETLRKLLVGEKEEKQPGPHILPA